MENRFKLDLNLQRAAMMQVAINFWNRTIIKLELQDIFKSSMSIHTVSLEKKKLIGNLLAEHSSMIKIFPADIRNYLVFTIENSGLRIFEWLLQIAETLKNNCNDFDLTMQHYIDNIILTDVGTIDSVAIFKKIFDEKLVDEPFLLYKQASENCLEDYIIKWKERFAETKEPVITSITESVYNFPSQVDSGLHRYFLRLVIDDERDNQQFVMTNEEKLQVSIYSGNITSVNHFLSSTNQESFKILQDAFRILKMFLTKRQLKIIHSDVLVYLLYRLSRPEDINNLFTITRSCPSYLILFLLSWPWRIHSLQILKRNLQSCDLRKYRKILFNLLKTSNEQIVSLGIDIKNIVTTFLRLSPVETKLKICNGIGFVVILYMLYPSDFTLLGVIINDRDVQEARQRMLDLLVIFFYRQICGNFCKDDNVRQTTVIYLMANLKKTILLSEDEKKAFDTDMYVLLRCNILIDEWNFDSACKLLNSNFRTFSRIMKMKNVLNSIKINNIGCGKIITTIWDPNSVTNTIEHCRKQTNEFLALLGVEHSIEILDRFRGRLSENQYFIEQITMFVRDNHLERFDALLNSCRFSESECLSKKSSICLSMRELKIFKHMKRGEVRELKKFLTWSSDCFDDPSEIFTIDNFIMRGGIRSCLGLIKRVGDLTSDYEKLEFFGEFADLLQSPYKINIIRNILKKQGRSSCMNGKHLYNFKLLMKALRNRIVNIS